MWCCSGVEGSECDVVRIACFLSYQLINTLCDCFEHKYHHSYLMSCVCHAIRKSCVCVFYKRKVTMKVEQAMLLSVLALSLLCGSVIGTADRPPVRNSSHHITTYEL
jgi:hypothetical protein